MKQMYTKGFTLIEVMITVAIIAVLATIAMPQYQNFIQKTGRADATSALQRMSDLQVQYVLRNNAGSYTTNVALIGGANTEHGYYTLSVVSATASTYKLQAVADPAGPQAGDKEGAVDCTVLTLTDAFVKTPAECWVK